MRLATRLGSHLSLLVLLATPLLSPPLLADNPPPPLPKYAKSPVTPGLNKGFVFHLDIPPGGLNTLITGNVEKKTKTSSNITACFSITIALPNGNITAKIPFQTIPQSAADREAEIQWYTSHAQGAGAGQNQNGNFSALRIDPNGELPVLDFEHPATATPTVKWTFKFLNNLPGTNLSEANGINATGICVGTDYTNSFAHQFAVIWSLNGTITDLNTLDNNSTLKLTTANAINDSGQIVGQALGMSGFTPFLYENGTATDLGTLGGFFGQANAINSSGQIVGESSVANGQSRAFLYENGMMTSLGTLPGGNMSSAEAINDAGLIIGYSNIANNVRHAVVWDTNGTIHDLNDLAPNATLTYTDATTINTRGDIFVQAQDSSQNEYGLFLTVVTGASGTAPAITNNPGNLSVPIGGNATFSGAATGSAPLTYQWYLGTKKITGATKSTYTIAKVAATNAGNYTFTATNSLGTATSKIAILTVLTPPKITGQPKALTVASGGNATFSLTATGSPTLHFYWQFSKTTSSYANLTMTTVPSFKITGVTSANQGNYRVIVSNPAGTATSSAAKLTVK